MGKVVCLWSYNSWCHAYTVWHHHPMGARWLDTPREKEWVVVYVWYWLTGEKKLQKPKIGCTRILRTFSLCTCGQLFCPLRLARDSGLVWSVLVICHIILENLLVSLNPLFWCNTFHVFLAWLHDRHQRICYKSQNRVDVLITVTCMLLLSWNSEDITWELGLKNRMRYLYM